MLRLGWTNGCLVRLGCLTSEWLGSLKAAGSLGLVGQSLLMWISIKGSMLEEVEVEVASTAFRV